MVDVYLPADPQPRLIQIARETLEDFVRARSCRRAESGDSRLEAADYGAFVTLAKEDELRGRIGTCNPSVSLRHTVMEMTEAAASRDGLMTQVSADELEPVHLDVSVRSPFEQASGPLSPIIGKHGLQVGRKGKRGVLLRQVATEHKWDMKTFLEQTCVKTELPKNAWRWPDTMVCSFTA